MSRILISLLLSCALMHQAAAAGNPEAQKALAQIDDMEWSLRHSSVAAVLTPEQRERSLNLIGRARSEVGEGHWKTALELTRRAGRPLAEMAPTALGGKHPDARDRISDLKSTMASILDVAEGIAREKSQSTSFVDEARAALVRADQLATAGQVDAADAAIAAAYARLQGEVASLRSGDQFVLDVPKGFTQREWSDGIRRYDERIQLSRYLLIEAQAEGIDPAPLLDAMTAAEASLAQATRMALADRWDQAYRSLDVSYLQLEESWRRMGVDW